MTANRGSLRSRPPNLNVGRGGPPQTSINLRLRELRETALAERVALRKGNGLLADSDLERRIAELNAHIKFLSEEIRRSEKCA